MYRYIVIILCLLFTTSCNDNSIENPDKPIPIPNGKRLALIIGNADYQFIPSLYNPVNDAEDVAKALRSLNYEVIVLTNASYKAMLNAVQQFAERLTQLGSVGLFYFSGHGLQTGGHNYLVPVDAKIKTEADIKPLSLNANHVLAKMNEAHSQVNVMILDACRDNPFEKSVIKSISSKGLAQIVAPSGSFISFATAPMQPAWGGKENERNSIYTKHLLAAMKNKPDVPVGDVFIGVRNQVMLETKDADAQQVPWDSSSLKHQFCFGECRSVDFNELKRQRALLAQQAEDLKRQRQEFERAKAQQGVKLSLSEPVIIPPVDGDKVNLAAIFNPPRNMFEKTEEYHLRLDKSLAKFNQAGRNGNKRYQAGVVYLTNYDADKEILSFEIRWQAKWVKQFFSDFPYENKKWIKIAPSEAKALWNAGKQKPFFIMVARSDDRSIIRNAIVLGKEKLWSFGLLIPEMVRIPAGSFRMGDIQGDGYSNGKPVHTVYVNSFAIGKYEVTFAEYDQFAEADGREKPNDRGWGRGNRPVINVSWHDATAYAEWLSQQTGQNYRLPTEAEWEYAARAGTETKYWWGNEIDSNKANCDGCGSQWDNKQTAPSGSFSANPFGLHDTAGNVWEWTCSEYTDKYNGQEKQCSTSASRFVLRGGSWNSDPRGVRSADRDRDEPTGRNGDYGFRLVRL
jgi:formylglycine-generating enzyme required for sulfatase activity/endogenous inhibitor of DNA gyrase (YacG/DUF329 family)